MNFKNTTLDDISSLIGFTPTLVIAGWFGDGNNMYVPANFENGQVLELLIGENRARMLSNEWPGEHIAIPTLDIYDDTVRRRQIVRMSERGFSSRETAGMFRMSSRRVEQIVAELLDRKLVNVALGSKKLPWVESTIVVPKKNTERIVRRTLR